MKTRTMFLLSGFLFTGVAVHAENLAAIYIAIFAHVLGFMLHVVEVKLNRILDDRGIFIGRDAE